MNLILKRMREPSTYAGIAALIIAGKAFIPAADSIATTVTAAGAFIAAILAVWLPETGGQKPTA
jgi:hypothetical protein